MSNPRPGTIRPEMGGHAVYVYTLGDALLACRYFNGESKEGSHNFHAAVNWFLTLADPHIGYYTDDWRQWQDENLRDDDGSPLPPDARLTKDHRNREVAHAMKLLVQKGVFGFIKKPYAKDIDGLSKYMEEPGG